MRKDYAVVTFSGTLSEPRMSLSTADRAKIDKRRPLGSASTRRGCSPGRATHGAGTSGEHPLVAVQGTRSGRLRLRADVSRGGSGGSRYIMDSGRGPVVGLQSFIRWSGSGWVGGLRVNELREWAISHGAVVLEAP